MKALVNTYQTMLLLLGFLLAIRQLSEWHPASLIAFGIYLCLAVAAALAPLGIPTPVGTLRLSFLFVLVALTQVPLMEAMVIAGAAALAESLYPKRPERGWVDVGARVAVAALATWAAEATYSRILEILPSAPGAALPMAAAIFFLVSAFALASVASLRERELLREVWQKRYLWSLPYYLSGAALAALFPAIHQLPIWKASIILMPIFFLVWRAYALQIRRLKDEEHHAQQLAQLQFRIIEAMAHTLEARDQTARDHLRRVTTYAVEVGRAMSLLREELDDLRAAALLHDIGKLAVPEHILFKPGRLTEAEFNQLKVHAQVGAEILERSGFSPGVVRIVRAHHEKWDGSGYPLGLKGKEIPLGARIIAVVDCLDALASDRQYRRAMPIDRVMTEIFKQRGRHFDPEVVDVLALHYQEIETQICRPTAAATDSRLPNENPEAAGADFITAIAAARQEEQLLTELLGITGSSLDLAHTLGSLSRRLMKEMPHETVALYTLVDEKLVPQAVVGERYPLFSTLRVPMGEGVSGWAASRGESVLNGEPALEGPEPALRDYHSALAIPLETAQGVMGVLTIYAREPDAFTPVHQRVLAALAPRLATAAEHSLQFRQAESMAAFDFLTGLPNAGSLMIRMQEEIARCNRTREKLSVLLCDLDGFKQVNDRFGHLTGNKVLQEVAKGLREQIREYDFVARMGGDEFVLILPGLAPDAVRARRKQLADTVRAVGRQVCGEEILAVSIGEAQYPGDERTAEGLLALADDRMYRSKHEQRLLRPFAVRPTAHDWLTQASAGD